MSETDSIMSPAHDMELLNAHRYEKLRDFLLADGIIKFHQTARSDSEPFVMGERFFGETFEDALDSLPIVVPPDVSAKLDEVSKVVAPVIEDKP